MSRADEMREPRVAYFSMEIALEPDIPTYSGGLGVLAGDMLRSAADLSVPLVGVTLASREGYFRQEIDPGGIQHERAQPWDPSVFAERVGTEVLLRIAGRTVRVGGWVYRVRGHGSAGTDVPVLLLDTGCEGNHPEDRRLTDRLYGGDEAWRLRQEMVLGIGGVRLLQALGVQVRCYHLNEGHAALLTLELLRQRRDAGQPLEDAIAAVQAHCVFTTHTPVAAGHDQFDHALAQDTLGDLHDGPLLARLAGGERLNMTHLALGLSGWVNGVAQRHAQTSRAMFPGYEVHAITNGVHPWTWASDAHRLLFDRHVPHWCHEPERLVQVERIPAAELAAAHAAARDRLIAHVNRSGVAAAPFEARRCTIGFARRMTAYKRPDLLFHDLERLRALSAVHPIQVVLAGKAHPRDREGKQHIETLHRQAQALAPHVPVAFLPGYDMSLGRLVTAGADLWLNTPRQPMEASGTSGMKAALNGVPSLSTLDGWWLEGHAEGVTGWAIGHDEGGNTDEEDAASLYDQLERVVLPLYHGDPVAWLAVCRHAIVQNGAFFHSHRMLRRYVLEAYRGPWAD